MPTKLFLRDSVASGIGAYRDLLTTAGTGDVSGIVNTAASGTQIQWTATAGGAVLEWISGRVPAGGFTLSGTMTFNIWARESNMNANCGARSRVFKRTAAGVESEVGGGPYNDGVEFGAAGSGTEYTWTGAPTSTAFAEDDRLIVRYYITNVGTMAGGYTCTLTYDAPDAATGDTFFQINETVSFKSEATSHATDGALTGQIGSLAGSAVHNAPHPTSGALTGPGSTVAGTAAHIAHHTTTGVLAGQGSAVAGSAARTRQHAASGALTGAGATVAGSAARTRVHATSGILAGLQAAIAGSAARSGAAVSHATSGALTGQLGSVAGSAARSGPAVTHTTTGALTGTGASLIGLAGFEPPRLFRFYAPPPYITPNIRRSRSR